MYIQRGTEIERECMIQKLCERDRDVGMCKHNCFIQENNVICFVCFNRLTIRKARLPRSNPRCWNRSVVSARPGDRPMD